MNRDRHTCCECGHPVREGGLFCEGCGANLSATPSTAPVSACPSCRNPVAEGSAFCGTCGIALTGDASTEAPAPAPEPAAGAPTGAAVRPGPFEPVEEEEGGRSLERELSFGVLRVISRDGGGREYPLTREKTVIGKDPAADVSVGADNYVSYNHACLRQRDGRVYVEDMRSRNGTFVQVVDPYPLSNGDRILIGSTVFEFEESSSGGAPSEDPDFRPLEH